MNWFTHRVIAGNPTNQLQAHLSEEGGCEHVENDINLAHALRREMDSFGPVSSFVYCKACDEAIEEGEGNEERHCHDCKQPVKKKDGVEWRWYDFYAPQGDEPLFVCNGCRDKEPHQNRVRRDREDRDAELGEYDD